MNVFFKKITILSLFLITLKVYSQNYKLAPENFNDIEIVLKPPRLLNVGLHVSSGVSWYFANDYKSLFITRIESYPRFSCSVGVNTKLLINKNTFSRLDLEFNRVAGCFIDNWRWYYEEYDISEFKQELRINYLTIPLSIFYTPNEDIRFNPYIGGGAYFSKFISGKLRGKIKSTEFENGFIINDGTIQEITFLESTITYEQYDIGTQLIWGFSSVKRNTEYYYEINFNIGLYGLFNQSDPKRLYSLYSEETQIRSVKFVFGMFF